MKDTRLNTIISQHLRTKEPTVEEFEAKMAPLRDALRFEVTKGFSPQYKDLTIRKMNELWKIASGGRDWTGGLEELGHIYDLDSPEDCLKWSAQIGHLCEISDPSVSFYPVCVGSAMEGFSGREIRKWELYLVGQSDRAFSIAACVQRLQDAGVGFFLKDAYEILKAFNRQVGGRKRSIRASEKAMMQSQAPKKESM